MLGVLDVRWWPERARPVGFALQVAGCLFAVVARRHLVRHPIYTGVLLALFGTAMLAAHLQALLAVPLMLAAYVRKIRMEERLLASAQGSVYEDYARRTAALIPGLL